MLGSSKESHLLLKEKSMKGGVAGYHRRARSTPLLYTEFSWKGRGEPAHPYSRTPQECGDKDPRPPFSEMLTLSPLVMRTSDFWFLFCSRIPSASLSAAFTWRKLLRHIPQVGGFACLLPVCLTTYLATHASWKSWSSGTRRLFLGTSNLMLFCRCT